MPTDVVMPQMGESIVEGTITKWLKKAGDRVEKDEPLFEISTDKVDAEIPSPVAGILTEIKVPEGATVEINTVVAVIGGAAPAPSAATPAAAPASAPAPQAKSAQPQPAQPPQPSTPSGRPLRSSPLVRRIAKENSLDLNQIAGTGSAGRITKDDALRHLSQRGTGSRRSARAVSTAAAHGRPRPHDQNARHHRPAHGRERPHQPPRPHRLQDRHDPHRAPPRARESRLPAAQRLQPHLHALYRHRGGRGAAPLSHRQRLADRHVHPIPPEHPSRHRRRA